MARYQSAARRRKQRLDRIGMAVCGSCALIFAAMLYGAYKIDQARGISIGESLASAGL